MNAGGCACLMRLPNAVIAFSFSARTWVMIWWYSRFDGVR